MPDTHVVADDPPLADHNPATSPVLVEALIREADSGASTKTPNSARSRAGRRPSAGASWPTVTAEPAHARPLRPPHRRDRIRPGLSRADAHGDRPRLHAAPWADDGPGAMSCARRRSELWTPEPGRVCRSRRPTPSFLVAPQRRPRQGLRAVADQPPIRPRTRARLPPRSASPASMSMTEKQGGSDVRTGTTQATPNADGNYSLVGREWFTSATMCDIVLVLARHRAGCPAFCCRVCC